MKLFSNFLIYIIILMLSYTAATQHLALNNPYLIDLARQNQLYSGQFEYATFSSGALFLVNNERIDSSALFTLHKKLYSGKNQNIAIELLPVIAANSINSKYQYGGNNASMLNNKGLNSFLTFGLRANLRFIDIQIMPEFIFSQNKPYSVFPNDFPSQTWQRYYGDFQNRMDAPDFQGRPNMSDAFWGQSHIALRFKGIEVAASTEIIKTGPARLNPLIMGTNAPGFIHYRLATYKPIDIKIGNIEYLVAVGRLSSSNLKPITSDSLHNRFWRPQLKDQRLFTLINFVYAPAFLDGLSLGFTRAVQSYGDNIGFDYFESFTGFFRNDGLYDDAEQLAGIYARWYSKKAKAEWYIEWARNDASYNLLDFLMAPEHSEAYTIGFQKFHDIGKTPFLFSFERTKLERSGMYIFRAEPPYYANGIVRHGHTQSGQFIANSLGPGSNSTTIEITRWHEWNQIGFMVSHVTYNNDFHTIAFRNRPNREWSEWTYGLSAKHRINNMILDAKVLHNYSRNFLWQIKENTVRPEFNRPVYKSNMHVSVNLIYPF